MDPTPIDLRSDTVTRPTAQMREAIAVAEVGDDVIGTDPTLERLEALTAEMLGKEAAIFMPSGSMTNQIAIRVHCKPGDEFICEVGSHIYNYEQAAFAQLSGLVARTVEGDGGIMQPEQLTGLIRPESDHNVSTRLVCIENTHNRGAGRIQPYSIVSEICQWARDNGLRTHLDGARLFNAVVATGIDAPEWCQHFDTVSVCFSKGLGAPVGSALAGPEQMIREARRHRKLFGGGMRQAGIIGAGALYALQHHVDRLAEDHEAAQILAHAIREIDGLQLAPDQVDTNLVFFKVEEALGTAAELVDQLKQRGVWMLATQPTRIRAVTHLDVTPAEVVRAGEILAETVQQLQPAKVV